jgi:hypothetical protein
VIVPRAILAPVIAPFATLAPVTARLRNCFVPTEFGARAPPAAAAVPPIATNNARYATTFPPHMG